MRPLRNTGCITLMSNRWPVPIHGSFVITTSPGLSVVGRKLAQHCRQRGRRGAGKGRHAVGALRDSPALTVENDAGEIVALAHVGGERGPHQRVDDLVARSRSGDPTGCQGKSRRRSCGRALHGDDQVQLRIDYRPVARRKNAGGLGLLDQRRAVDDVTCGQRVAVVYGAVEVAAGAVVAALPLPPSVSKYAARRPDSAGALVCESALSR